MKTFCLAVKCRTLIAVHELPAIFYQLSWYFT